MSRPNDRLMPTCIPHDTNPAHPPCGHPLPFGGEAAKAGSGPGGGLAGREGLCGVWWSVGFIVILLVNERLNGHAGLGSAKPL